MSKPEVIDLRGWHTLRPLGRDAEALPVHDEDRRLVRYAGARPMLTDEWQSVKLADGRMAEVRRADCGAGCRCSGEIIVHPTT